MQTMLYLLVSVASAALIQDDWCEKWTLVNSDNENDIMPLENHDDIWLHSLPSYRLNIRADVRNDSEVGSIEFSTIKAVDGPVFAVYGLVPSNSKDFTNYRTDGLNSGNWTVTATPYSGRALTGEKGPTKELQLEVHYAFDPATVTEAPTPMRPCTVLVEGFYLVDANANEDVGHRVDPFETVTMPRSALPSSMNVRAVLAMEPYKCLDSLHYVDMMVNGARTSTERYAPYSVLGDRDGDFAGGFEEAEVYEITATVVYKDGTTADPVTVTIDLENRRRNLRSSSSSEEEEEEEKTRSLFSSP